jgi:hypothetical protein
MWTEPEERSVQIYIAVGGSVQRREFPLGIILKLKLKLTNCDTAGAVRSTQQQYAAVAIAHYVFEL